MKIRTSLRSPALRPRAGATLRALGGPGDLGLRRFRKFILVDEAQSFLDTGSACAPRACLADGCTASASNG